MLFVIYEAVVPEERWEDLKRFFPAALAARPRCMLASALTQDLAEPEVWRMFSTWSCEAAFKTFAESATALPGVYLFRLVDAEASVYLHHIHLRAGAIQWPSARDDNRRSPRKAPGTVGEAAE
jgi:hypothetical protein